MDFPADGGPEREIVKSEGEVEEAGILKVMVKMEIYFAKIFEKREKRKER